MLSRLDDLGVSQKKAKQWLEVVTRQELRADDSLTDLLADGVVL